MNEISLNIGRLIAEIMPDAILAALEDACQLIENDAVDRCPRDDGTLRASITHSVEQEGSRFIGSVGSNLEYAPYVHEGTGIYAKDGRGRQNVPWVYRDVEGQFHSTKGQHPRPFLQQAVDESIDNIKNRFAGCIDNATE